MQGGIYTSGKMKGIKIKMIAGAQMLVMNFILLTEFN